jgi:predicted permease
VIAARLSSEYDLTTHPVYYRLDELRARFTRLRPVHMALGLAVGMVLLIACANLSTLILMRTLARQRELAVRAAIGATRSALIRVILSEAIIIAAGGALIGVFIAVWAIDLASAVIPRTVEQLGLLAPRLSWRVFAFCTVTAAAAVLIASVGPALRAAHSPPDAVLRDGSGTHTRRLRLRYNPLVIGTLALSLTLTMGSGLLLRSSAELHRFTFGYDTVGLSLGFLRAPASAAQSDTGVATFYESVLVRARAVEGIERAALFGNRAPERQTITIDDPGAGSRQRFHASYRIVSPTFLSTLGIRIIDGRDFETGDEELGGVAVVDETMARELWPNVPAIGRVVKLGRERSTAPWVRIIGVARSAFLEAAPGESPTPELYVIRTLGDATREMRLAARVSREAAGVDTKLMRAMNSLAPNALVAARVHPWTRDLDALAERTFFITAVLVMFAGFGVLIAIVGLYGVLAYAVQQRTRELAVRVALGATRRDLARLVTHDAAVMVLGGIGTGAFLALWAVRRLRFAVFGLDTYDPIALLAGEMALVVVAAIACLAPLRSAIRADPIHVLRSF